MLSVMCRLHFSMCEETFLPATLASLSDALNPKGHDRGRHSFFPPSLKSVPYRVREADGKKVRVLMSSMGMGRDLPELSGWMRKHWRWLNLLKAMRGEPWAWRVAALLGDAQRKQCERKRRSEVSTFRALIGLSASSQWAYSFESFFSVRLECKVVPLRLGMPIPNAVWIWIKSN